MILHVHPETPQPRLVSQIVKSMQAGGVIILPTDTVYGFSCDVEQRRAIEKVYHLKNASRKKPMSIICPDLSVLSEYVAGLPTSTFRILKRLTPGPYTFILEASSKVPRLMLTKQRTIGIRVPDCPVALAVARALGHPYLSSSLKMEDETLPVLDPDLIYDNWKGRVDMVVDAGIALADLSTVVDLTEGYPVIVREGRGDISSLI